MSAALDYYLTLVVGKGVLVDSGEAGSSSMHFHNKNPSSRGTRKWKMWTPMSRSTDDVSYRVISASRSCRGDVNPGVRDGDLRGGAQGTPIEGVLARHGGGAHPETPLIVGRRQGPFSIVCRGTGGLLLDPRPSP